MCINLKQPSDRLTIAAALKQIDDLTHKSLTSTGAFTPYQMFIHCAQSVEYSMSGYPQPRPEIFQKTIGKVAFSLFSAKGEMTHPLDEPIPGAPPLETGNDIDAALLRLRKAYTDFERYNGVLFPHFTYGELSKEEYTIAHVMHINNHLKELEIR